MLAYMPKTATVLGVFICFNDASAKILKAEENLLNTDFFSSYASYAELIFGPEYWLALLRHHLKATKEGRGA